MKWYRGIDEAWKEAYDMAEKVNAWRQHAQARTGGEMVTALVELERVGEIKYLKEKKVCG